MSNKGKQFLSDLKLYSDYLKFDEDKGRYETWEEACDKVLNTHRMKYGDIINPLLEEVKTPYYNKEFLASQRNLQFREDLILKNNCKLYYLTAVGSKSHDASNSSLRNCLNTLKNDKVKSCVAIRPS